MSRAIILQHVEYAGPGRIVPIFRDFGIPTDIRRLWRGDEVPTDLDELRVLVVLGGPMSVKDVGSEKYPFLAKEVQTLQRLVSADRAVLGIALGAQLLAHAAGAKVYPNAKAPPPSAAPAHATAPAGSAAPAPPPEPLPEYGWGPVTFPFPGGTEPIVQGLMDGAPMFHWHSDTFDLPRLSAPANPPPPPAPPPPTGSALLCSSKLCKNEAFRFKTRLFGFQYHFEFFESDIAGLISNDRESLVKFLGPDGEQRIKDDTAKYYARYARLGDRIVKNFVQYLRAY
jgi:GMP synthase-like glutamine amidotransferase